jgi:hypothetical protein
VLFAFFQAWADVKKRMSILLLVLPAFGAVKTCLETHPEERYRPRRYQIIQGLRAAYPCPPR